MFADRFPPRVPRSWRAVAAAVAWTSFDWPASQRTVFRESSPCKGKDWRAPERTDVDGDDDDDDHKGEKLNCPPKDPKKKRILLLRHFDVYACYFTDHLQTTDGHSPRCRQRERDSDRSPNLDIGRRHLGRRCAGIFPSAATLLNERDRPLHFKQHSDVFDDRLPLAARTYVTFSVGMIVLSKGVRQVHRRDSNARFFDHRIKLLYILQT